MEEALEVFAMPVPEAELSRLSGIPASGFASGGAATDQSPGPQSPGPQSSGPGLADFMPRPAPIGKDGVARARGAGGPGPIDRNAILATLRQVHDPEIPVNIYDLGLIYDVDVEDGSGLVAIRMTLTAPACPVAGVLPGEVAQKVSELPGVAEATVELVWHPPWNKDMMSEDAKLALDMY